MENQIVTIQNVRGYCDENGTAWINAEDAARGLGFTQTQEKVSPTSGGKIYESIRWERVNGYLREFGFPKIVGKDDFLPENMFYRLAMKANNEAAQEFQARIADDIMPAIRKTGSYSITQEPNAPIAAKIFDIGQTAEQIQKLFAVQRGIAISQAIDIVGGNYNLNFNSLKQLLPPAEHETGYLNPTQIGKHLGGLPPKTVNKKLADKDWQYLEGKYWRLTEAGKAYGEEMPYTRNGHSGYQIRWSRNVIPLLQ